MELLPDEPAEDIASAVASAPPASPVFDESYALWAQQDGIQVCSPRESKAGTPGSKTSVSEQVVNVRVKKSLRVAKSDPKDGITYYLILFTKLAGSCRLLPALGP